MSRRILYVEHSVIIGGSSVSLKEILIEANRAGYDCHVICSNEVVGNLFREVGAAVHICRVAHLSHNTAYWYRFTPLDILRAGRELARTLTSFIEIRRITRRLKPDAVHLNSSTLIAYTSLFRLMGIPTMLHIRENIVRGYLGFRRSLIRTVANIFCTYIIFISEFEYELLGTRAKRSVVIYNFVHVNKFREAAPLLSAVPASTGSLRVITLGGLFSLKGGKTIIESLLFAASNTELHIVGSVDPRMGRDRFEDVDTPDYVRETMTLLENPDIAHRIKFFGKVSNPEAYISGADALIFWAGAPHFPRTVFEAWILRKPVIYFNPRFPNPIINEHNVAVVRKEDPGCLADAINRLGQSYLYTEQSRDACFQIALENFSEKNFKKIAKLYENCFLKSA